MKDIVYLSPSAIALWHENQHEFYMKYLSDDAPPRFPQTQPMSIGSAFDAYVKSYLHERLFGKGKDPKFEFQAIFEAQVEEQHRDWALSNGKYAFEQYKQAGALADLMLELTKSIGEPRFEFEVKGAVNGYREGSEIEMQEVVLLGKPDVHYINGHGTHVILDFKVNGYCSKSGVSPMKGYLRMRSAGSTNLGTHKECSPMIHLGMMMNVGSYLESTDESWARQLSIYAWLCGCPVGSEFITAIDQLACKSNPGGLPSIRVAEHRTRISNVFQWKTFRDAANIWEIVHSDHIFRDETKQRSAELCIRLDGTSKDLGGDIENSPDAWFANATRVV